MIPKRKFKNKQREIKNPTLTIEVNGGGIYINAEWAPGTDLTAFARTLAYLNDGVLLERTLAEMENYGHTIGEADVAAAAQVEIINSIKGDRANDDDPIILPSRTLKHNAHDF